MLAEREMGQTVLTVPRESDIPPALTALVRWRIEEGLVREDRGAVLSVHEGAGAA